MYSLARICYICLQNNTNSEFTNILNVDNNGIILTDKIQCLLPEFVNFRPQIPKFICFKCLIDIDNIYQFRQKCLQNLSILKKYLHNENTFQNNDVTITISQPISSKINKDCKIENLEISEFKSENLDEDREETFLENIEIEEKIQDNLGVIKCENLEEGEKYFVDGTEVTPETNNQTHIELNSTFFPNRSKPENAIFQPRNEAEILHSSSYEQIFIKEENIDDNISKNLSQDDIIANHDVTDAINKNDSTAKKVENCSKYRKNLDNLAQKANYKCSICQKIFKSLQNWKYHNYLHLQQTCYKCNICQKSLKSPQILKNHILAHQNNNLHECKVCKKEFKCKQHLKRHERNHQPIRPYQCSECDKNFTRFDYLTEHTRVHTRERKFECEICKKRFLSPSNLRDHVRTHSGVKPFECRICKTRYTSKHNLKIHLRKHTGELPYGCELCSQQFGQKYQLKRHLQLHKQ